MRGRTCGPVRTMTSGKGIAAGHPTPTIGHDAAKLLLGRRQYRGHLAAVQATLPPRQGARGGTCAKLPAIERDIAAIVVTCTAPVAANWRRLGQRHRQAILQPPPPAPTTPPGAAKAPPMSARAPPMSARAPPRRAHVARAPRRTRRRAGRRPVAPWL